MFAEGWVQRWMPAGLWGSTKLGIHHPAIGNHPNFNIADALQSIYKI